MTAVGTDGLTKRFRGGQLAVNQVSLSVPRGAVYGFLGPNGSGKTTTIRMLLGLVTPTAGSVELLGRPIPAAGAAVLPRVGALVEGPAFHSHLSGRDNLRRLDAADATADRATAAQRIGSALERVGLTGAAGKRYRAYSLGMRQRLAIAAALLRPRELLVLDEPTNGLDPQGTREVRSLVRDLASDGATVLVSSHLLAEVEQMCTHVGVMSAGRLVRQGPLGEVGGDAVRTVTVLTPDAESAAGVLRRRGAGVHTAPAPEGMSAVSVPLDGRAPEDLARDLVEAGVRLRGFTVARPALEDLYISLTGEGFDVAE